MEVYPVFKTAYVGDSEGWHPEVYAICTTLVEAERFKRALGDDYYSIEIWQLDKPEGRAE